MAPSDYIEARRKGSLPLSDDKDPSSENILVEDKPYFPFLPVLEDIENGWENSCRKVVVKIFGLTGDWTKLQVRSVEGGNTNVLFCVSSISALRTSNGHILVPDKVLVRVFGGHGLIDRDVETSTYAALAAQGLALPYYGRFANGRLEGWSEWKCLDDDEMGDYSIPIAHAVATLHCAFQVPAALQEFHNRSVIPTMWIQLDEWIRTAVKATFFTSRDTERAVALKVPELQMELQFLKGDVIAKDAVVGFCHNDVLAANILADKTTKQVQLIDFEYGGMNYWSYDIANHFNEFAGGTNGDATPNYDHFPSRELQVAFVREYMMTRNQFQGKKRSAPSDDDVENLLKEISGFVLANHLVWALWAINQASTEGCTEFDYLQYAKCRIERYYHDKAKWLEEN